ncbi:Omp28-related outer membrane protein, partial [Klebsiella pneumoniae]|uniref:Omp28-related outer membrane protein n=1 Tax=Klebsiella pneumoniae TaxID=573 RepID=UPI0025A278E8
MTIYLTESNVPAIYQQGATGGFYHHHLIRTYNSIWGEPITWNDDNTFSFDWSFEVNDGWNPDNLEVVALAAAFDA